MKISELINLLHDREQVSIYRMSIHCGNFREECEKEMYDCTECDDYCESPYRSPIFDGTADTVPLKIASKKIVSISIEEKSHPRKKTRKYQVLSICVKE